MNRSDHVPGYAHALTRCARALIFVNTRATPGPDNFFISQGASMNKLHSGVAAELDERLAQRELELCAMLQELTYGLCLDCREPIDLRRLSAMPATPYCASCQSPH